MKRNIMYYVIDFFSTFWAWGFNLSRHKSCVELLTKTFFIQVQFIN